MSEERYYRIFISSVGKLLEKERKFAISESWKQGFFPIAMEGFNGTVEEDSLEVVINNLEKADYAVITIGCLYGDIIKNLKRDQCKLKGFCDKCMSNNKKCVISYTHFEYLYFKKHRIICYAIFDKNYNNLSYVTEKIQSLDKTDDEKSRLIKKATKDMPSLETFIKEVNKNFRYDYSDINEYKNIISRIHAHVRTDDIKIQMKGLLPAKTNKNIVIPTKKFVEEQLLPIMRMAVINSFDYNIDDIIRSVVVKYYDSNRMTIYESPNLHNTDRKKRKKTEGVVGIMNKEKKPVFHFFSNNTTHVFGIRSPITKKNLNAGNAEKSVVAILAAPIKEGNKIIGALTFDFDDKFLNVLLNLTEQEIYKMLDISRQCAETLYNILHRDIIDISDEYI